MLSILFLSYLALRALDNVAWIPVLYCIYCMHVYDALL